MVVFYALTAAFSQILYELFSFDYADIVEDEARAKRVEMKFEKLAENYPYPVDIAAERELMEIAKQRTNN